MFKEPRVRDLAEALSDRLDQSVPRPSVAASHAAAHPGSSA
jgi:hypothetical protein